MEILPKQGEKITRSDLQRRLDAQYDRIDEVEETMAELKSQIYELKKNQIEQIAYTDF